MLSLDTETLCRLPRPARAFFRGLALIVFLVSVGGARPCAALAPNLSLSQIQHTGWTAKQGAPADIWALAQSPDGFLLLGTGSGLYRFDGVLFERVIPSNQSNLGFRDITALLALPSGEVWIGYYAGGASDLKDGILTSYSERDGMPSGWITSFAREEDGTLWAAAREGLGRFSAGHWELVSSNWNFRGHGAHWVLLDHQGTLWVAGGETVVFLPKGGRKFEDTEIHSGYKSTLTLAPDGTVWLAGESVSPRPLLKHQATIARDESVGELDPVKRLIVDRDGSIWATDSLRGGIYRARPRGEDTHAASPNPSVEMFSEAQGLTADLAVPVLEDTEGNVWVGTNLGLNRFKATPFVREPCIPASRTGYSLSVSPIGSVWIASNDELFQVSDSRCEFIGRVASPIRSAYRAPTGALMLGTHEGLVELINRKMTALPMPAPATSVQYQYVHAITSDSERGGLLVSVIDRGLLRLDDNRWSLSNSVPKLPDASPTALWTDDKQRQWFGYGNGTAVLRADHGMHIFASPEGLNVGPIMVICGSSGAIFIGGEWGLARFDGQRFRTISAARSEAFSGISGIISRGQGDIWLNGGHGVIHMSSNALNNALEDPKGPLHYDLYDVQDGLPGYAQQGEDVSAIEASDGRLWFATNHGIASIDPDNALQNRIVPNVVIRSVVADQRPYRSGGAITLLQGTRSVRIDYTALSLGEPERVRFRYRLEGADDTWRDAGTERAVRYANLRPGRYTFRVIASKTEGVWNHNGATVSLTLPPAFYQTRWFLVLAASACIGLLWLLTVARLRQITYRERKRLEQRMEERLVERSRIARDLHDSLLQGFQGLMFRLEAVREHLRRSPEAATESLDSALKMGDLAIIKGREAIQNLRSETLEQGDLATLLGALGSEISLGIRPQSMPSYRMVIEGTSRELSPNVRDDIYKIAREAVRNAYQHANAQQIEVKVIFGSHELQVRVRDDGIGLDPAILLGGQIAGHWGLPGMRERSESIGGRFNVRSEVNAGTDVDFTISSTVAYSDPAKSRYRGIRRLLMAFLSSRTNANQRRDPD